MTETSAGVRLDKWLWAARFYKTRALAKSAIEGGKVHYNKAKAKPSRVVEVGAEIRLRVGFEEKTVTVTALSDQRRGAPEAALLFSEAAESIEKREQAAKQRKLVSHGQMAPDHKPNKKQRRDIHRFKTEQNV